MNANDIFGKKRCIDIVFCIDGTRSMSPCIKNVKANAKRFYTDFEKSMKDTGNTVEMLRIKLIVFRDYKSDGDRAMEESPFFELPTDNEEFSAYLDSVKASGGCGRDANGLEALYFAMKSDFVTGKNDRQVIVLFADTTAIPLKARSRYENYPSCMVDDEGLLQTWMCSQSYPSNLRERNKRLVFFAPDNSIYEEMSQKYNRSIFQAVHINKGLDDVPFDEIIKIISASASAV